MELTFHPKPHPLLLLPPRSDLLSGAGPHSRLLPLLPRLRPGTARGRRELRSRRRPRAPTCSLAEPADSGSFLAAAAAAVAALVVLPVFCFDSMRRRDRAEVEESSDVGIPGALEYAELEKQSHRVGVEVEQGQHLDQANPKEVTLIEQIEDTTIQCFDSSPGESGNEPGSLETERPEPGQNISVNNGMIKSDMPQTHGYELPACSPSEHVDKKESRGNVSAVQIAMDTGRSELSYQGGISVGKKGQSVRTSSLLEQTIQLHATCSAIRASDVIIEMPENSHSVHKVSNGGESQFFGTKGPMNVSSFNEVLYEEAKPIDFKYLSQISQQFTLQDNTNFGSSVRLPLERVKPHTKEVLLSSELVPSACFKEAVGGEEQIDNAKSFRRDTGKRFLQQPRIRKRSRYPDSEKRPHIETTEPSLWLNSYYRLLSNGRLHECIELLESSEKKGVLDMDKVYHRRFLQNCKTQKAVQEAFRFTKLIKKPTLSTFNMLLSICAKSQSYEGALQVLLLVKDAGLRPDCQLYTTLISTCGKSGKVDAMFEVFHEMVNAGVEPNAHTYGALIDGCARAGQVAKAFGAYGIMRSKDVKPDRVIFNALITACGQSGAVDRAFDVLAEMMAEPQPIDPDHVTVGALMKTCIQAGQADRAREVYKMLDRYNIKGTADVYTIAVNNCSLTGDLEFALNIYDDMKQKGVDPDEMFLSTIVDVAGHAGKVEVAFEILHDARVRGIQLGTTSYGSLMGACSNAMNWEKAVELYEEIKALQLLPTVSTLNALITSLCDGNQLLKATEVFNEMKEAGIQPDIVTYSILSVACERKDEIDIAFDLLSQAKEDGIQINLIMFRCLTGLCQRRVEKAYSLGERILSFNSAKPLIDSKWTKLALMVYRQTISAGIVPSTEAYSQVLGCLKFPNDISLRSRFVENLGITFDTSNSRRPNLYSLIDGFGEYDPRSFSILEEASSLGVIPCVSFKESPIIVDTRKLQIHTAQVYVLIILKGLKNRLAAGARLPNVTILVPTNKAGFFFTEGEKTVNLAGRVGQAVGSMLRRLGLPYQGDESYGKLRISGLAIRRWLKPKITFPSFGGKPADFASSQTRLAKEIANQQRSIRSSYSVSLN